eukprot:7013482-Prymnesium_polylepis.1
MTGADEAARGAELELAPDHRRDLRRGAHAAAGPDHAARRRESDARRRPARQAHALRPRPTAQLLPGETRHVTPPRGPVTWPTMSACRHATHPCDPPCDPAM